MNRSQETILVPLLCWAMWIAPIATGAESVLSVIPDEALGLVVINRLSETDTKLQDLTQAIQLPLPGLRALLKTRVGMDQGLDTNGSIAVAVLADPAGGPIPVPVLFVPVTDYEKFMEKMFGAGKQMTFYLAAADQHTIVLSYVGPELLLESLDVVRGTKMGLASNASLAQTAAMLSTDASWGGYLSPRGVVNYVKQAVQVSRADGEPPVQIPEFPATPPLGLAVTVEPDGLRSHCVIPAATLEAIGQYAVQGFARRGGANVEGE